MPQATPAPRTKKAPADASKSSISPMTKVTKVTTPTKSTSKTSAPSAADAERQKKEAGRQQALDRALGQIEKAYGTGSIMKLDGDTIPEIPSVSTGTISLDLALGGRGLPRGRVIEIFGPESSGKTTLALTVAANAQKDGGVAAMIDAEHALDPTWAKKLGVNLDELLVSQPDTGEQALEICELLVRSNAVDVVIVVVEVGVAAVVA